MPELKKVQVTNEHVNRALKDVKEESKLLYECCVIYHALHNAGIPVKRVRVGTAWLYEDRDISLPDKAVQFTATSPYNWAAIGPTEFEVEVPDAPKEVASA